MFMVMVAVVSSFDGNEEQSMCIAREGSLGDGKWQIGLWLSFVTVNLAEQLLLWE